MTYFYNYENNPPYLKNFSTVAGYFNEFAQTIGGINQIINPDKEQQQSEEEAEKKRINKVWKIFLVVAIIIIVLLLVFSLTKKVKARL